MSRLLLTIIVLIVYGSLFPFRFHTPVLPRGWWAEMTRSWPALNRYLFRDGVINVLLYIPLGVTACLTFMRRFGRIPAFLGALLLGIGISASVEIIQLFDYTRTSSVFDTLCNGTGTAVGAATALLYSRSIQRGFTRHRRLLESAPGAVLLFCLFAGGQLYPLFPRFSWWALRIKLGVFFRLNFNWNVCLGSATEWLCAALVVETLFAREHARRNLVLIALLLPARFLLAGPTPQPADFLGLVAAAGVWAFLPERPGVRERAAAVLVIASLVVRGLAPYHFAPHAAVFAWLPFGPTLDSIWDRSLPILLNKGFEYGTGVWLLHRAGLSYAGAGAAVAVPLAALEFVQLWLPGRTPEITDPFIALLMSFVLRGLEEGAGAKDKHPPIPVR